MAHRFTLAALGVGGADLATHSRTMSADVSHASHCAGVSGFGGPPLGGSFRDRWGEGE